MVLVKELLALLTLQIVEGRTTVEDARAIVIARAAMRRALRRLKNEGVKKENQHADYAA